MPRPGVAVVGGGSWGVALAAAAARTHGATLLWSRRARGDGGSLPKGVTLARDFAHVAKDARVVMLAVPSQVVRDTARALGDVLDGRHFVVHGIRGLVGSELATICDIVREETPVRRVGALGGPALASDLIAGRPSVMVCGSSFPEVNDAVCRAFAGPALRMYPTEDLRGLEWASALVGCLVIGVGYARGLGMSAGLLAAAITRSIEEAARIAHAAGGHERTLLGLAGYGDLLASIAQAERPEVMLGEALAKRASLADALRTVAQRVEAVELVPRIVAWAEANGVQAPIFDAIARGVLGSKSEPDAIVHELMTAPLVRGA
jgi:glycerol-3-phosphate dehydrogenase (NAD(P)+)